MHVLIRRRRNRKTLGLSLNTRVAALFLLLLLLVSCIELNKKGRTDEEVEKLKRWSALFLFVNVLYNCTRQGRTGHGPTREVQRQRALGRVHGCWALIYRQLQQHIPVSTRGKTVAVAHFSSKRRRGEGRKEGNKTRGGLRTCKTW